ncbi:hypothetical protein ICN84_07315 [Akkermansia glycaniphila]|uniref:hypothetical protein n=1 Tax=Akkermansia glycaniphila TaxID=1679444 RepID=UPI001C023228|nr:hypothetical protein [Akkermansia glycaniphila]MBT9449881.1 hypothetical protein [Akkermansia glycaniphila]
MQSNHQKNSDTFNGQGIVFGKGEEREFSGSERVLIVHASDNNRSQVSDTRKKSAGSHWEAHQGFFTGMIKADTGIGNRRHMHAWWQHDEVIVKADDAGMEKSMPEGVHGVRGEHGVLIQWTKAAKSRIVQTKKPRMQLSKRGFI